jgi:hypothetical protein
MDLNIARSDMDSSRPFFAGGEDCWGMVPERKSDIGRGVTNVLLVNVDFLSAR